MGLGLGGATACASEWRCANRRLAEGARTEGLPDDEISATENPPGATRRGAGGARVAVVRCCVLTCTDVHRVEQTRGFAACCSQGDSLGRVYPDGAHCDRYYSFKPRTRGANGTSGVSDWESRTQRSGHRPGDPTLRSGTLFLRSVTLFHGERTAIRALTK
jgi:hypothetical protein